MRVGLPLLALAVAGAALASPPPEQNATRLAAGIEKLEARKYSEAVQQLKTAQPHPKLPDYVAFYLAGAHAELKDYAQVRNDLAIFHNLQLASPLAPKAMLLEAKALVETSAPADAVILLREHYSGLPQPSGDLILAQAYEAQGDFRQAVSYYQNVYYGFPATEAAARAATSLAGLRESMGASFPAAAPRRILDRGAKLLEARDYTRARNEMTAAAGQLQGADGEIAKVLVGAADYLSQQTAQAYHYLQSLEVSSSEADAERLYYVVQSARRLREEDNMMAALRKLGKRYPQSPWRSKALLAAANGFLVSNRFEAYEPLYRACYEGFPSHAEASYCHWKVTWIAYLHRRKDAPALLREQIARYPASAQVGPALYFLGRLAENAKDFATARAYYDKIVDRYPHYYYGILTKERLSQPSLVRAVPAEPVAASLAALDAVGPRQLRTYEPNAINSRRIERARILAAAGLTMLAETELKFGAKNDGQPHLMAMELAQIAESPFQGLRFMKSMVSDYFLMSPDAAPPKFWELLFPLPFRSDLVRQADASALDAHILAGLVRQESEFNPQAVSRVKAYGLTQIMPGTGRQLARLAGIRGFNTGMLFQPSINLRLGTTYLRSIFDKCGGKWEQTLASYNAGPANVQKWLTWAEYQEPAEFVETIPFTETREYVQSVLRNAAAYRRIYGAKLTALEDSAPKARIALVTGQ